MGKTWCYILNCEDNRTYVGKTNSLYKRFNQHIFSKDTKCTKAFKPTSISALYDYENHLAYENFKKISVLDFENEIVGTLIENSKEWYLINGGKYTNLIYKKLPIGFTKKEDLKQTMFSWKNRESFSNVFGETIMTNLVFRTKPKIDKKSNRPLCYCGKISEVNVNKYNFVSFECPMKNANRWVTYRDLLLDKPCDFKYEEMRMPFHLKFQKESITA